MKIQLDSCLLREWRKSDADALVRHGDNPNVWRNLRDRFPHPFTRIDALAWIEKARADEVSSLYAIVVDGEASGGIGVHPGRDVYRRSAEIGFWLGESRWGRGIMTEAVRAVTAVAFERYDVCRVFAYVFEWNPASMRVLEKAGYVLEGRQRKSVTKDGQTIDQLLYVVIRD
jgi:RimJ/RimL family protein N-acetyltransferase